MAKHDAADPIHEETSTYAHRSKLDAEAARLKEKLVAEGKVLPGDNKQ